MLCALRRLRVFPRRRLGRLPPCLQGHWIGGSQTVHELVLQALKILICDSAADEHPIYFRKGDSMNLFRIGGMWML